jgi:hypothetical protein
MAGPLATVGTITQATMLDVNRQLYMGPGVALDLLTPDQGQAGGLRLVRRYDRAFHHVSEDDRTTRDGYVWVFHLADYNFPEGQVAADLGTKELYLRWTGGPDEPAKVNTVTDPAADEAQVWIIEAVTRRFKRTYFDRA